MITCLRLQALIPHSQDCDTHATFTCTLCFCTSYEHYIDAWASDIRKFASCSWSCGSPSFIVCIVIGTSLISHSKLPSGVCSVCMPYSVGHKVWSSSPQKSEMFKIWFHKNYRISDAFWMVKSFPHDLLTALAELRPHFVVQATLTERQHIVIRRISHSNYYTRAYKRRKKGLLRTVSICFIFTANISSFLFAIDLAFH